jgi:predicted sugar kinase
MEQQKYNSNSFYRHIIANSLFTTRQIHIISRKLENRGAVENISSGAYYRQVKQCRTKLVRLLYSIILLKCVGALDKEAFSVIERMVSQIQVILNQEASDNLVPENVMSVIEQLVKRMCKV